MRDASGKVISQQDFQAGGGSYPSSVWAVGETVTDCAALDAPAAASGWRVAVGLYNLASGQRLPLADRNSQPLTGDSLMITP